MGKKKNINLSSVELPQRVMNANTTVHTVLWANSIDDKLMVFFLFFPQNRI